MVEDPNSVEEEVTPHDQDTTIADENTQEYQEPNQESDQHEDGQEKNWRELRRKAEDNERKAVEAEKRIQEQEKFLRELLLNQQKAQQPTPPQEVDEFANIAPDDYPTWDITDKRIQKRAEQIAEQKYRELRAQEEKDRFLEKLKSRYTDFDDVVNSEAIANFEKLEPELAQTIADLQDPYKMGVQTYKFLKAMNGSSSKDDKRHAEEVKAKLQKNENSVQSPQAFNKRPMAQAFSTMSMSKADKQRLYEEMMGYASQAGSGY